MPPGKLPSRVGPSRTRNQVLYGPPSSSGPRPTETLTVRIRIAFWFKTPSFQVILKPSPANIQIFTCKEPFPRKRLGRLAAHDVPAYEEGQLGVSEPSARGEGWQVLLVVPWTFTAVQPTFQPERGIGLDPVSRQLTYGLDRIWGGLTWQ